MKTGWNGFVKKVEYCVGNYGKKNNLDSTSRSISEIKVKKKNTMVRWTPKEVFWEIWINK